MSLAAANQQDQLLKLHLLEEIDQDTFVAKGNEAARSIARLSIQVEAHDGGRAEQGEIALAAFEPSQTLEEKWLTADVAPSVGCLKSPA
jgi:hypothetical protein